MMMMMMKKKGHSYELLIPAASASLIACQILLLLLLLLSSAIFPPRLFVSVAAAPPPSDHVDELRSASSTSSQMTFDRQISHQALKVDWHSLEIHRSILDSDGRALLGSAPPKCIQKCATCTPCSAVRVPIHPGRMKVRLMEYYPEAWRCKCKNKLYMP